MHCFCDAQFHIDNQEEIRKILGELSLELPHYSNMHWRLDVQVGSKSLRNTVEATYLMRIDTESSEGRASHHIEADFANLQHLYQVGYCTFPRVCFLCAECATRWQELDSALKASKQPQYRSVARVAK